MDAVDGHLGLEQLARDGLAVRTHLRHPRHRQRGDDKAFGDLVGVVGDQDRHRRISDEPRQRLGLRIPADRHGKAERCPAGSAGHQRLEGGVEALRRVGRKAVGDQQHRRAQGTALELAGRKGLGDHLEDRGHVREAPLNRAERAPAQARGRGWLGYVPGRLGGEGDDPYEHGCLLLVAFPRRQVRQHVGDREIERLHLLALHRPGAVGENEAVQRPAGDAAARHDHRGAGVAQSGSAKSSAHQELIVEKSSWVVTM